jgi:hypothetical protein
LVEFVELHAATLWQCDFMSLEAVTPKGFRALFVLMFLHVQRRRVVVTLNPVSTIPAADGTPAESCASG